MTTNKRRRSTTRGSTSTALATLAGNNGSDIQRNAKKQKSNVKRKSHWSRPGVEAAARLASLPISSSSNNIIANTIIQKSVTSWNTALQHYKAMIKAKGGTKLYNLDQQRDNIATQWRIDCRHNNGECEMTKDQLCNSIIPWKFLKGKPRNALKPLLQSNKEGEVIEASKAAFKFADASIGNNKNDNVNYVKEAINSLCQLSGVGPATASAVLSAYCPQSFAFMDDEVIECLYEAKRGYTLKIYMAVNDQCVDIAEELNKVDNNNSSSESDGGWTPADVAKSLWTVATMAAKGDNEGLGKVFGDK